MAKNTKAYSQEVQKSAVPSKWKDFAALVKFRLNITVVFSSVMAYLIAADGIVNWSVVMILALGGFFITGAANTLNEVLEADFDKMMKRTEDRPIAAGRMTREEGILWAGMMSLLGISLMSLFNVWAALFSVISLIAYAFVYTPMKRVSPFAVTVGAVPGALPMLIGCVAYQGEVTWLAITLFAIQFFWQFPHFWAIGWLGNDDYTKAGFKLLPFGSKGPGRKAGWLSMWYALVLVPLGVVPFLIGEAGLVSAIVLPVLAVIYAWFGWNFYQKNNRESALATMFSSFAYLPIALFVLLVF